jgi:RNA polymerase sigma-70 factor (ECF subfamily)
MRPFLGSSRARQVDPARLMLVPREMTRGARLYERVAPVVNRMVWLYLATDPERDDVAQDVFVAIVKGADSVRDPGQLEAWAGRVAFNTICNVFRRRRLLRWLSLDAMNGYELPDDHADFEGRELLARTQRILDGMPVAERMPFTLQLLGNANLEEIARLCACSERTVRRRVKAARARFVRLVRHDTALASRLGGRSLPQEETPDG